MMKINFLKPDKDNLHTYLYTGIFLFFLSVVDVPLNSFLLGCFNQHYKITPEMFNVWIKILK